MPKTQPWWKTLIGGLLLICLSIGMYFYLLDIDQPGESKRILAPIAFLYNTGGIWLATLPFAGFGFLMIGIAFKDRETQKKENKEDKED
ncbi:MAG: hypothetical protein ACI9G1_005217 [Pirellulaceae bacterium]|jgi:hypothetical protein